ncbi:hypothetical protein PVL29_024728 [Vitis rotundifolia]|uniref:TIR domain-containing protein n=1 Tax=Vitis rotundifolia TaxID=103349 RepID=A0AA38YSV0_VITRO|nr:hypothetical protein PVL29_024728 [Vitis rotundifolia]
MASTSTFISSRSYDVFLSFRGKDTRTNFTDHLYTSLVAKGIHTFREDEELERGGVITPELLKAIEKSKISIIIFSENYASSRWCLDEVEKIMECRIEMNRRVSPVFYHVDPSDVRKQMESYGEAFIQHEKDADQEKSEKIKRWRTALSEVGSLSGWHVHDQYESKIIREITSDVLRKLNQKIFHVGEHIVGMNYRLRTLLSLINNIQLNDIPVVGIYGYGGIGKTTIAKAICNEISYQFESISFLENVRERSKASFGMLQLQEQLLDDVLMGMKRKKISSIGQGINVIKERVSSKKVLIVLDDVNDLDQLKALAGNHSWFGLGSIIIITTRNKHLLRAHGVNKLYEPSGLTNEDAIQLFSWNAFKTNRPIPKTCALLSRRVVVYARGLPLALKVFGSFLFGKTNAQWESALAKLKEKPNNEVQDVLEISYDGLDDMEKDIFLDIACFFKGQSEDFATRILDGCNFHAKVGMRVLSDRCLITLSNDIIGMHDLLQEMCWKIVCQTSPKEPGKWSRLWDPEDIYQVLTTNTVSE